MSVRELFDCEDILDYFVRNADTYCFKSDKWMFIHIPKTAGSSLREEIANVKQPDLNIEVQYDLLNKQDWFSDFDSAMRRSIDAVSNQERFHKYNFISGHFKLREIQRIPNFDSYKLIAVIRDPVKRLVSDYNYQISKEHPLHISVRQRYPSLMKFVRDPINHNVQFQYLCRNDCDTVEATLEFIFDKFVFVGIQEAYPLCLQIIFALFGMRGSPSLNLRERPQNEDVVLPSQEEGDEIATLNKLDYQLYNAVLERLIPLGPKFFKLRDYDRIFRILNELPSS
jgi:hypothetical protein